MGLDEKVLLNVVFFDNRLRELELKQWWIAEQIKVDRKTISRWLSGQTKKIRRDNLLRLARLLECEESDLTLTDEFSVAATAQEQKVAASLIEQENLLEILTPGGKWPLLEGLIKASMEPNLPKSLLGQLYNYLCIAAWRQSDLDKAEGHLKMALKLAEETGHQSVLARAKLNQATLNDFRGNLDEAIKGYLYCIENKNYFDDEGVYAAALSNIACSFHEKEEYKKAVEYQLLAISEFEKQEKDLNLSIAYAGLCDTYLAQEKLDQSWKACEQSLNYAEKSNLQRGIGDAHNFFSLICSANKEFEKALEHWQKAKEKFSSLGIDEGRTYRVGATAYMGLGQSELAKKLIEEGVEVSKNFPNEVKKLKNLLSDL